MYSNIATAFLNQSYPCFVLHLNRLYLLQPIIKILVVFFRVFIFFVIFICKQ